MDGRDITLSAPTGGAIAREWARSWCTRASAALLLVLLFSPFSAGATAASLTLGVKLAGISVFIVSFARPTWSIVVGAALLPLVMLLQRPQSATTDIAVLFAGVIVCGALLRLGSSTDRSIRWPAVAAFAAVIVLSFINAVGLSAFAGGIRQTAATQSVVVWMTGLGLALLATRIAQRHRRLGQIAARMLIIGAAMVAAASWIAVAKVAADFPRPLSAVLEILIRARVSTVFADPNAAGSFLALFIVATGWLCFASDRGWRWLPILFVVGIALWLSGSRTALASACIALVAAWLVARRPRTPVLGACVAGLALVLSYLIFAPPTRQPQASSSYAVQVRIEMARVALAITSAHPLLGVGPGNFQAASRAFISPDLAARFPPAAVGENAHNNFLQVLAELGVVGLVAFIGLLFVPLRSGWRALRGSRSSIEGVALWFGAAAFLVTCLAGHPLLTPAVMLPFFFSLGLGYGLTTDAAVV